MYRQRAMGLCTTDRPVRASGLATLTTMSGTDHFRLTATTTPGTFWTLALGNRCKGRIAPTLGSPVVDEERIRPAPVGDLHWLGPVLRQRSFGYREGIWTVKKPVPPYPKVFFQNRKTKNAKKDWLTQDHLETAWLTQDHLENSQYNRGVGNSNNSTAMQLQAAAYSTGIIQGLGQPTSTPHTQLFDSHHTSQPASAGLPRIRVGGFSVWMPL